MTISKVIMTPEMERLINRGRIKDFIEIKLPQDRTDDALLTRTIRAQQDITMFAEACGYDWLIDEISKGGYIKDLMNMLSVAYGYEIYDEELIYA
jgi:hypothetical protein